MKAADITVEMLLVRFRYDPDSGRLFSILSNRHVGSSGGAGYVVVRVFGAVLYVHRIAIALSTGAWPSEQVDHRNGDRSDNRLSNLRECSAADNARNRRKSSNNKSGVTGVTLHARAKKWQVQISIGGRNRSLGYFTDKEEASRIYADSAIKHHGDFTPDHVAALAA